MSGLPRLAGQRDHCRRRHGFVRRGQCHGTFKRLSLAKMTSILLQCDLKNYASNLRLEKLIILVSTLSLTGLTCPSLRQLLPGFLLLSASIIITSAPKS